MIYGHLCSAASAVDNALQESLPLARRALRACLRGGIESKARRGELKSPLPIGLAYDDEDHVVLEPDRQVQETIRKFFKTF
jgi:DNA invertase Pin-like site-specific DNA recombinase